MKSNIRNDADAELPQAHLLQVIYLIVFAIIWFLDSFIFSFSTFLATLIPLAIRLIIAISVLALGFSITSLGHWLLFNKKLPGLVTTGILAHVRHPMYLGYILAYLACIVGTMSLLSIIPWLLITHLYAKMANYEEQKLEQKFGKEYLEYTGKVPKWIPR